MLGLFNLVGSVDLRSLSAGGLFSVDGDLLGETRDYDELRLLGLLLLERDHDLRRDAGESRKKSDENEDRTHCCQMLMMLVLVLLMLLL